MEKSLASLVSYYKLPLKVSESMKAMLDGEGGDLNSFIRLIHKEMEKKSVEPNRIVQDLVIFGVKDGKQIPFGGPTESNFYLSYL